MSLPILLLGGGGHAGVLLDVLRLQGATVLGIVDRDPLAVQQRVTDVAVIGSDERVLDFKPAEVRLVLGIGSVGVPHLRRQLFELWKGRGYAFANVIHPSATIAQSARLGEGVQIMAGAVVQPAAVIGDNVIVNTRASVDHDCVIGAHAHIAPGAVLSGSVTVGERTHIGTGATVIQGITVGANSVVGAGAVVVRDIKAGATAVGVPARER